MRVGSEKQTLILAGEPIPPRAGDDLGGADTQLQRVPEQPAYGTGLLRTGAHGTLPSADSKSLASLSAKQDESRSMPAVHSRAFVSSKRTTGAAEYVRLQSLVGAAGRNQLIDVYA
jgi:hypothetical protein